MGKYVEREGAEPINTLECKTAKPTILSVGNYQLILPALDMFIFGQKTEQSRNDNNLCGQ